MKFFPSACFVLMGLLFIEPLAVVAQDVGRQIQPKAFGGASGLIGDHAPADEGKRGIRVENRGGSKVISVSEGHRDIEVIERADGHLLVNVTRHYGPQELDALIRRQPELEKAVQSFPRQVADKEVQLSISLTERFEGANENELRAESIAAFSLYQKYSRQIQSASPSRIRRPGRSGRPGIGTRQIGPAIPGYSGRPETPDEKGANEERDQKRKR